MGNIMNVRQWIENFNNGEFNEKDKATQCYAGWYDWFCRDTSLRNKTYYMSNIIRKIKDSPKIGLDTQCILFRNHCPISHPLYDSFKISNITSGEIVYEVNIKSGFEKNKFTVYGIENMYQKPLFGCDRQKELVKWFNS